MLHKNLKKLKKNFKIFKILFSFLTKQEKKKCENHEIM